MGYTLYCRVTGIHIYLPEITGGHRGATGGPQGGPGESSINFL
jgi:hypothetical protein